MNYSSIAFSEASKKLQQKAGSRVNYERMSTATQPEGLTVDEIDFIERRDSFYLATVGENGFPYIQFRGGPKGFLKALDERKLAFIDFRGNMQYISSGNLATNNKVALILIDYPAKARLKIFAEAEIVSPENNVDLYKKLYLADYKFRAERIMILHVKGYSWNCPQHITPRYTLEEFGEVFGLKD